MTDFHLQPHLHSLTRQTVGRFALAAQTPAEITLWQAALRAQAETRLGIAGRPAPIPTTVLRERFEREAYTQEHYTLTLDEGITAPMVILIPHTPPPYKAILAFHGHGPGLISILDGGPDEAHHRVQAEREEYFAPALARAGYLVCALEQRGMGERITDQHDPSRENSCQHLATHYLMHGQTLLGERVRDGIAALTTLQARPDVMAGSLGVTGFSGGGTTALWLAALDERVRVAVIAGAFCGFDQSILAMPHCLCNYVPGIRLDGETGDFAALIAPRPMRLIHGTADPIFPIDGTREQFATVERAYQLFSAAETVSLAEHSGGHVYHQALSEEWFQRWLAAR